MKEIYRILKPKGKLIIFTSTPNQMENYWLNNYFPKMMEKSIQQMPSIQKIETELVNTGFQITETEKYFVTNQLQDFFFIQEKKDLKYICKKNSEKEFRHLPHCQIKMKFWKV